MRNFKEMKYSWNMHRAFALRGLKVSFFKQLAFKTLAFGRKPAKGSRRVYVSTMFLCEENLLWGRHHVYSIPSLLPCLSLKIGTNPLQLCRNYNGWMDGFGCLALSFSTTLGGDSHFDSEVSSSYSTCIAFLTVSNVLL